MGTEYLVTTVHNWSSEAPVIMVDGTVPGWKPRPIDFHFDHHRIGGAPTQIQEIPEDVRIPEDVIFITTQLDADACVAAAWLKLLSLGCSVEADVKNRLIAIAYDCDHLGLPADPKWDPYRAFAREAVAALKIANDPSEDFPADRKSWDSATRARYYNEGFKRGVEWLVDAALGKTPWPGEQGEAISYWNHQSQLRSYVKYCSYMDKGIAILDRRSLRTYLDPRIFLDWVREQPDHQHVTLTIGDFSKPSDIIGYSYTLGCVPLHPKGSPCFSTNHVWEALARLENVHRVEKGLVPLEFSWSGREDVGGSGWNDPSLLTPSEVLHVIRKTLGLD
jgi:hypothetical protein